MTSVYDHLLQTDETPDELAGHYYYDMTLLEPEDEGLSYSERHELRTAPSCYCEEFDDAATCSSCIGRLSGDYIAEVMAEPAGSASAGYAFAEEEVSAMVGMRIVDRIPLTRHQALAW